MVSQNSTGPIEAIEAVVFDMGGVLTVDPFQACRDYAAELSLPTNTFVDQFRGPEFAEVETGQRSVRDFLKFACRDVEERLGVSVDIRRLADCLAAGQRVRPEMVTLVQDLVRGGVKVGLLTNNAKEARSWWTSGVLPVASFAVIIDSSEVGMRKPGSGDFRAHGRTHRLPSRPLAVLRRLRRERRRGNELWPHRQAIQPPRYLPAGVRPVRIGVNKCICAPRHSRIR